MQLILHVEHHGTAGPVLRFLPGRFVVGRDPDCQIRVPERAVSRRHCLLTIGPDGASVRDLGSRNRTLLNSRPLDNERPLRDGDRLSVCSVVIRVRILVDAAPVEPSWITVPADGPGISLDPPCPRPAIEAEHSQGATVAPWASDLAPGPYDIPLNVPGTDLAIGIELRHLLGRGAFGQVWWVRIRGSAPDWHDGALKISHYPVGLPLDNLCRWGATAVARVPSHPGLLRPRMIGSFHGRTMVEILAHPAHVAEGARDLIRHGDPAYLAPEVWAGWACGASDQYALACGFADLWAGRRVFPAWDRAGWERSHRSDEPDLSRLPAGERAVLSRALAKEPERRYGSCREFAEALAAATGGEGTVGRGRSDG